MITIVDYGMGNLGSVHNMFKRIGVESQITGDPEVVSQATKILLPGVGAYDAAMKLLNSSGLREVLEIKAVNEKIPILGICLGMQLLTYASEEGKLPGLGWIPAQTVKFKFPSGSDLKVPHMGWNIVYTQSDNKIVDRLKHDARFYFVHSYFVQAEDPNYVVATTDYGGHFHSIIAKDNVIGAQFHPEKSHKFGMKLLENFSHI